MRRLISGVVLLAAVAALGEEQKSGLVVFDLKGVGTQPMAAEAVTISVVRGLRELDAFEVISSEDLRSMLAIERQKQLLGVEGEAMTATVQALGVRHQVVGSLTQTAAGFTGEIRLLDTADGKVVSQKSAASQPTLDSVSKAMFGLAQELVGPLLTAEQGTLLVRTREEGAEVLVDDVLRGSTPLLAPLKLPRGRHRLTVKKEGFIARVGEVTVKRDQLTLEDATLVPSPDFVAAYQTHNKRLRIGAWVGTAVAVAALSSALLVDRFVAEPRYQNEFLPRQRVLSAFSGNPQLDPAAFTDPVSASCAADTTACRQKTSATAGSLQALQAVSWSLLGVGLLAAGGATYCWLVGEDPARYAQLVAGLLSGGSGLALTW